MSGAENVSIRIRLATDDDADGILSVYAPYIDTPITFEESLPNAEDFGARTAKIQADYPYLVAETVSTPESGEAPRIVGYAYAHAQAERAAYGWNAELSVYLSPEARGRGLGTVLYRALIDLLREQGVKAAYALVTIPNAASERLHEALGFTLMGVQKNAGYTCGAWRDVAWLVLALAPFDAEPAPVVPFPALARERPGAVRNALARANAHVKG